MTTKIMNRQFSAVQKETVPDPFQFTNNFFLDEDARRLWRPDLPDVGFELQLIQCQDGFPGRVEQHVEIYSDPVGCFLFVLPVRGEKWFGCNVPRAHDAAGRNADPDEEGAVAGSYLFVTDAAPGVAEAAELPACFDRFGQVVPWIRSEEHTSE